MSEQQTPPLNDTMQVLILDDEEAVTRAVSRQLDELPADIHRCCTIDEAEIIAGRRQIDVALIDHNLVGSPITGLEYLIQLQRRNSYCFRIIFTGEADFHFAVEAINQGNVDAFLPKPWNDEQLRMLVRQGAQTAWLRQHNSLLHEHLTQQNEQLNNFNAQLEELVRERTVKLEQANDRLDDANRELKSYQQELVLVETQAAISQMVQGLAHELNNPLAVILGYAQRYQRRHADDDKLSKCFRIIREEGERARTLISELRRFGKSDADPLEYCSIEDLFSAASKRLQERHERLLPCYLHGDDVLIDTGRRSMVQAIEKILENANENDGTTRIDVRCEHLRNRLHMHIDNDGQPPSAEAISHGAKPFFTSKGIDHPGLGLSLASSLVGRMGCSLRLNERPDGLGGRITLVFPPETTMQEPPDVQAGTHLLGSVTDFQTQLGEHRSEQREQTPAAAPTTVEARPAAEQPAAEQPAVEQLAVEQPADDQPAPTLVIDDEELVLELISDTCGDLGMPAVQCNGILPALELLRQRPIGQLISDANLDDGDLGDFLDQALAAQPHLKGRILLVTGDADAPAVKAVSERHGCPILAKPFRIAQLAEHLQAWR